MQLIDNYMQLEQVFSRSRLGQFGKVLAQSAKNFAKDGPQWAAAIAYCRLLSSKNTMESRPYQSKSDLPENVKNVLPNHAQEIYIEAYNSAWEQDDEPEERRGDGSREETADRVAWSAVNNK